MSARAVLGWGLYLGGVLSLIVIMTLLAKYVARPQVLAAQKAVREKAAYDAVAASRRMASDEGLSFMLEAPMLGGLADTDQYVPRSPVILCEEDRPLGPAHAPHTFIRRIGLGRFSHWHTHIFFSTPDGSDAITNGRQYWASIDGTCERIMDGREGFAYFLKAPDLADIADKEDALKRSPALLCENEHALGPPHSPHEEIRTLGAGRFSHWHGVFVFSTSDGSDPNTNGRRYWVSLNGICAGTGAP